MTQPDFAIVTVIDNLRCLDAGLEPTDCEGEVDFRDLGRFPQYARCEKHLAERLELQERLNRDYPDSPHAPSWFDPTAAGEVWDEDY